MRAVSPMTANQEFSRLVREVERGEGFLITPRGRPIAKLVPHSAGKAATPEWAAAPRRPDASVNDATPTLTRVAKRSQRRGRTG